MLRACESACKRLLTKSGPAGESIDRCSESISAFFPAHCGSDRVFLLAFHLAVFACVKREKSQWSRWIQAG